MISQFSTSNLSKLENLKKEIRAILIALGNRDVTLPQLNNMYTKILDTCIPFKDFNYLSLQHFLSNIPDVVSLKYNANNELCVYYVEIENSKHVSYLVSKEKVKSSSAKNKIKSYNNVVDPIILNEILHEFKISAALKNNNKVHMLDVLSRILNCIGVDSFYTMENLKNQLYEFTHLLSYDNIHIYFKKEFLEKNDEKQNPNILMTTNENSPKINLTSTLIKDITKHRLQKLVEKYKDGIWCSDLPSVYCQEYKLTLEYTDLGFNSIIEFANEVPDVIQIIKPENSTKQLIVDARMSIDEIKNLKINNTNNLMDNIGSEILTENESIIKPIPTILSVEVSKTLIPPWAMNIGETVDQIRIASLFIDSEKYLDLVIAEIYSPSFFWIIPEKNSQLIDRLMSQLQEFYNQQNLDNYKIPSIILQKGLHIACIYAEVWHRGIIKEIYPDETISVFFYDFGTIKSYGVEEIYFLDRKFSTTFAQAIPCSLCDVKPFEKNKWPTEVIQEFTKQVYEKLLIASVCSINEETNSMEINLIDINSDVGTIYINEWMVTNKLAEWGVFELEKKNVDFTRCKICKENKKFELLTENIKNISINDKTSEKEK